MRTYVTVCLSAPFSLLLSVAFSNMLSAQVPTRTSEPRLATPRAEVPTAQPADQPTAQAPAPAPSAAAPDTGQPTAVTGPPSGVTQLPTGSSQPTSSSSQAALAAPGRAYGAGNVMLDLDGVSVGFVRAMEGGAAVGTVVAEGSKKHLGGVKYEELSLKVGIDSKAVVEWIRSSWEGKSATKNLSVSFADQNYKAVGRRDFTNALLTGTTIPALDPASKEPVSFTLTVASDQVREIAGDGGTAKVYDSKTQKKWLLSNFRFEMDNLPGQRVSRIESFTVGQKVTEDQHGEFRLAQKQPGTLVIPNLKITLSQADAADWGKWHDDFVVKGNNGDEQEKNGAIVFLDPTMKNELGRISLFNCGIFRLGTVAGEANADKVGRISADLYCEGMDLAVKDAGK